MLEPTERRDLVEPEHRDLSIRRQCELLGLSRSSYYYVAQPVDPLELELRKQIDRVYTRRPYFGSRKICEALRRLGHEINRKRVQRLMQAMGLVGLSPRPGTSQPGRGHEIYPYLLRGVEITHRNHVWSTDITYIALQRGFCYLVAVLDWYSRYVLSWEISGRMTTDFCLEALEQALVAGRPRIFNTDQGSQFTSEAFTSRLKRSEITISMDGRGRCHDNIFIERLWRTVKYEDVYLREYPDIWALREGLQEYFAFYNTERPHQSLGYLTPYQVYTNTA